MYKHNSSKKSEGSSAAGAFKDAPTFDICSKCLLQISRYISLLFNCGRLLCSRYCNSPARP